MVLWGLEHTLAGGIGLVALASTLLLVYVIFDVVVSDEMILVEKLIWIVLAAVTGLIGIAVYLYLVKYRGELIEDHTELGSLQSSLGGGTASELERLRRMKEDGDLTEEEFESAKKDLLEEDS